MVEAAEVKHLIQRSTAYAVAELNLIARKFEARIPAGTDEELIAIMRQTIKDTVRECCTILAEMEMDYRDDEDNTKSMEDVDRLRCDPGRDGSVTLTGISNPCGSRRRRPPCQPLAAQA